MGTYQTIDLTTLDMLRVACLHCKAAIEMPISSALNLPQECPNCKTTWFSTINNELTAAGQMVTHLANALIAFRAATPIKLPVRVQFVIQAKD